MQIRSWSDDLPESIRTEAGLIRSSEHGSCSDAPKRPTAEAGHWERHPSASECEIWRNRHNSPKTLLFFHCLPSNGLYVVHNQIKSITPKGRTGFIIHDTFAHSIAIRNLTATIATMRLFLIALCASLVLAASSAQISAVDVDSSSSSSVLLLARSDVASSVSSSNGNLSLAERVDDATASADVEEIGVEADDEDSSDDTTLEGRARKHRHHRSKKHSGRRHRQKSHVHHKTKHSKTKPHQSYTSASKDGTYEGKGTFFSPNQGACGKWNTPGDKIVALSKDIYDDGSHCFDTVKVCHKGKCVDAKVADLCPGCKHTSLDMTTSLFKELADLDVGVIDIQWSFV